MPAYLKYRVHLRGELDLTGAKAETVVVPITSFEATYPLNGIPRATVVLAAGRTLGDTGEFDVPSPAHLKLDAVKYRTRVRVYARVQQEAGVTAGAGLVNKAPFPDGEFLIFDGAAVAWGAYEIWSVRRSRWPENAKDKKPAPSEDPPRHPEG